MNDITPDELAQYADALLNGSHNGILIANEKFNFVYANEKVCQITGYSKEEIIGKDFRIFISEESLEKVSLYYKLRQQGKKVPQRYEATILHKSGRKCIISINSLVVNIPGLPPRSVAQILDITKQKQTEIRNRRLLRLYNVLRQISQSIQRAQSSSELLNDVAHIFTDAGTFALCWIGLADTESQTIHKKFISGPETAYINHIDTIIENKSECTPPFSTAFTTGECHIENAHTPTENACTWMTSALKFGLKSSAAVPVKTFSKITAIINLYAYEENFFDEDEKQLVEEAAADIGYALEKIELKKREDKARRELMENEKRYQIISKLISDYMYAHKVDNYGAIFPEWAIGDIKRICGYGDKEIVDKQLWPKLVLKEDRYIFNAHEERIRKGMESVSEYRIRARDGSIHWIQDSCFSVFDKDNDQIIGIVGAIKDITLQKNLWFRRTRDAEKIARIYTTLADAILVIDENLDIIEANDTARTMFGYKRRQSLMGKNVMRFLNPDNLMKNIARLKELEVTDKLLNIPMVAQKSNHHKFPALISLSKLKDENNKWNGFVAIIKDVSAQEAQKKEIAAIKEQLEHIINNSPGALYALAKTKNTYKPTYLSANLPRMLGYLPDEIPFSHNWWKEQLHPDDKTKMKSNKNKLLKQGHLIFEYRIRQKSGAYIWIRDELKLLRKRQGAPIHILGSWIDITERKMAEEELRFLALALRSVHEYVTITDLSDRLIFVNDALCRAYGYASNELLGQNVVILRQRPYDKDSATIDISPSKTDGWQGELINRRKDGTEFPIHLSTSVIRDENGKPIAYIGVGRDLSEVKDLEQKLMQAQRLEAIGRLAGGVAHDFNNLLTVIIGSGQLAQLHLSENHPALPLIKQIENASERATGLTRKLLAFSRKQVMEERIFDINHSIRQMAGILHRLLGEHIELLLHLDKKIKPVSADPNQFEMVIMNLCVNSRDAMPEGGIIEIHTHTRVFDNTPAHMPGIIPQREYVYIAIKDTGCGIPPDILPHIFEPFFTTKSEGNGTGLGLSTVYGIVRQSGGVIDVDSSPKGSVFHLYFPATDKAIKHPPAHKKTLENGSARILVVEDQREVLDLIEKVLTMKGFQTTAIHPRQLKKILKSEEAYFDVLLTDVIMPHINGVETAKLFRERFPKSPVIFMSGYTSDVLEKSGQKLNLQQVLVKPFTPEELISRIQQTLIDKN